MSQQLNSSAFEGLAAAVPAGDVARAVFECQQRVKRDPDDGAAWELLGRLAFANRDFAKAQAAIEQASSLVPLSASGQLVLGRCYRRGGFVDSAVAIFRHLAGIDDLPTELLEPLAAGLGSCGECELALNVCRRAAKRLPDRPEPLLGIVHYMRRLGRPLEITLPAMYRVHELEPDNAQYRVALAWMLTESGRFDEAVQLLESIAWSDFCCQRCLARVQEIFERSGRSDLAFERGAQQHELENRSLFDHGSPDVDS